MDSVHFGRAGLGRCSGRLSPACNHLGRHSLSLSPDCRLPATFEGPAAGTVYALACGVFCDLLLPSPIPCFYTLILPLVGLAAGLLSQSLIPAGYLCSAAAGSARLSADRHLPLHCPLGSGPSRMGCGHVRDPAGAVRLPAVEPAYDLAVPPGLSPRSC